jgi:hypothetical protein
VHDMKPNTVVGRKSLFETRLPRSGDRAVGCASARQGTPTPVAGYPVSRRSRREATHPGPSRRPRGTSRCGRLKRKTTAAIGSEKADTAAPPTPTRGTAERIRPKQPNAAGTEMRQKLSQAASLHGHPRTRFQYWSVGGAFQFLTTLSVPTTRKMAITTVATYSILARSYSASGGRTTGCASVHEDTPSERRAYVGVRWR